LLTCIVCSTRITRHSKSGLCRKHACAAYRERHIHENKEAWLHQCSAIINMRRAGSTWRSLGGQKTEIWFTRHVLLLEAVGIKLNIEGVIKKRYKETNVRDDINNN